MFSGLCALTVDVPHCLPGLICVSLFPHGFPHLSKHSGPSLRVFSDYDSLQLKLMFLCPASFMRLTYIFSSFTFPATARVFNVQANREGLAFFFSFLSHFHFLLLGQLSWILTSPNLWPSPSLLCCSLGIGWLRLAGQLVTHEHVGVLEGVGTKALQVWVREEDLPVGCALILSAF